VVERRLRLELQEHQERLEHLGLQRRWEERSVEARPQVPEHSAYQGPQGFQDALPLVEVADDMLEHQADQDLAVEVGWAGGQQGPPRAAAEPARARQRGSQQLALARREVLRPRLLEVS
jgi:hypothetical protein